MLTLWKHSKWIKTDAPVLALLVSLAWVSPLPRCFGLSCRERGQRENIVSTSVQHSSIAVTTSRLVPRINHSHSHHYGRTIWSSGSRREQSCRKKEAPKNFQPTSSGATHVCCYTFPVPKTLAFRPFWLDNMWNSYSHADDHRKITRICANSGAGQTEHVHIDVIHRSW